LGTLSVQGRDLQRDLVKTIIRDEAYNESNEPATKWNSMQMTVAYERFRDAGTGVPLW